MKVFALIFQFESKNKVKINKLARHYHSHGLLVNEVLKLDGPGSKDDDQRDEAIIDCLFCYFQRGVADLLQIFNCLLHLISPSINYKYKSH